MTDLDLQLVKFVEKHPFLYDSKHEKSKDKLIIENAWSSLSSHLGIPGRNSLVIPIVFATGASILWHFLQ